MKMPWKRSFINCFAAHVTRMDQGIERLPRRQQDR
jgi:hypothetical protein